MFHPNEQPMERGWVGRIDGDRVLHLAAQTLQSFFLGGGGAREHAEYRLDGVTLLVPVIYPPAVRVFESQHAFEFANPMAVRGPAAVVVPPAGVETLTLLPRLAAVIGAEGAIGGFSLFADWRAPGRPHPKDRDFSSVLGPVVATPDELGHTRLALTARVNGVEWLDSASLGFDWDVAREFAAAGTELRTGDILVAPALGVVEGLVPGATVELDVPEIGVLATSVGGT
ncbi:MAG: fumarylacetoacetate hydrolase family protein, partial [Gaiellaceae bacterium]